MDFVTGLPISTNWKRENYDSILVIIDWLIKIVYYELVKIIIDTSGLAIVILDVIIWYYGLPDLIMTNWGSVFTSKFWSSLCYFLGIKQMFSIVFYPQTDGQTKRQMSTMKTYFWAIVNFE